MIKSNVNEDDTYEQKMCTIPNCYKLDRHTLTYIPTKHDVLLSEKNRNNIRKQKTKSCSRIENRFITAELYINDSIRHLLFYLDDSVALSSAICRRFLGKYANRCLENLR